jgi:hypothetical protein
MSAAYSFASELAMLTALILICSAGITADPATCTRENAATVIRVPSACGTPATCFMNAQAYLAQTSLGRELGPDDRVKIICDRSGPIAPVSQ